MHFGCRLDKEIIFIEIFCRVGNALSAFLAISEFLERILMGQIEFICTSESQLFFVKGCAANPDDKNRSN